MAGSCHAGNLYDVGGARCAPTWQTETRKRVHSVETNFGSEQVYWVGQRGATIHVWGQQERVKCAEVVYSMQYKTSADPPLPPSFHSPN